MEEAAKRRKSRKETMQTSDIFKLCDQVRETAFAIHRYHRQGHAEKIYENALVSRLRRAGVEVKQQHPLSVLDEDGTPLGEFYADLLVENELVVELKATRTVADEHIAQLLGYLRSSRREHGLLLNFGSPVFHIKKYALSQDIFPN
jgi:GxxExxY protein